MGPILHVGEELAEKGERKREEDKTTKELEPDHKEEGDGLEEEAGNGSNSKPQTTPQTSGLETLMVRTGAAAETMEDKSDYMEPADAIPRDNSYGFKLWF